MVVSILAAVSVRVCVRVCVCVCVSVSVSVSVGGGGGTHACFYAHVVCANVATSVFQPCSWMTNRFSIVR